MIISVKRGQTLKPAIVEKALKTANRQYAGNLQFKRFEVKNDRRISCTLRVDSSIGHGSKIGLTGRRTIAACWHAHRDFLQALFELLPTVKVQSAFATYDGRKNFELLFHDTGDINIGTVYNYRCFYEACECRR